MRCGKPYTIGSKVTTQPNPDNKNSDKIQVTRPNLYSSETPQATSRTLKASTVNLLLEWPLLLYPNLLRVTVTEYQHGRLTAKCTEPILKVSDSNGNELTNRKRGGKIIRLKLISSTYKIRHLNKPSDGWPSRRVSPCRRG